MILDETTSNHLKPWLVRTLEPICDAEPGALADYILALLKHNVPESEMRTELATQLDEFLEKECAPFVDTLFNALRSKSYLPYRDGPSTSTRADGGIPIPLDGMVTSPSSIGRKRPLEQDDIDTHPPSKGPRLSSEAQFSRYGARDNGPSGSWGTHADMGRPNVPGRMYQPPPLPRGLCRDYHYHGFCMRGNTCKYSHGQDVIVSDPFMFPMAPGGLPFLPLLDGPYPMEGGAYDPHQSQMDMTPYYPQPPPSRQHRPSIVPRAHMENGSRVMRGANGELPVIQDLTPNLDQRQPYPRMPSTNGSGGPRHPDRRTEESQPAPMEADPPIEGLPPSDGHREGIRHRHDKGPKPPGTSDASGLRPEKRKGLTLVIEKIPREKLSLAQINEWFKRFGAVTNVAIDASQGKALVSFATNEEAHAAWKCKDAVFNNRFVKVFWHRPLEGHGHKGSKMLAASAPLVASLTTKETQDVNMAPPPAPRKSSAALALAEKQERLEKQIAEQKLLMASLEAASSSEEKKEIMTRLRTLGDAMKEGSTSTHVAAKPQDRDDKLREQLDKELEIAVTEPASDGSTTEALKEQLEKLKAEAASLGLPHNEHQEQRHAPYRGARGRGRGRIFHRGFARGGFPRGNQKLDNRPKKLLISGLPVDDLQPVRDWYQNIGQVESVVQLPDETVLVAFHSRSSAEQALAKGNNIPNLGQAEISWYTGVAPPAQAQAQTQSQPTVPSIEDAPQEQRPEEEELVSSGWGDGDEGSGMI